jgi:SAM-dependent methyltransferase
LKKIVINLGCGRTRIPGSIGVDQVLIPGFVDVVQNLNELPYPFEDNSADEVHFYHVLEHLDDPLKKLEEIHRILKPDGILHLRCPHFSSNGAFTDITHKRPFSVFSFDVFEKGSYHSFYTEARFSILKKEIKYFGLYPNSGDYEKYIHPNSCPIILRPFVKLMNFLINQSPMFFERIWCYWVGGACEVVLELKKDSK